MSRESPETRGGGDAHEAARLVVEHTENPLLITLAAANDPDFGGNCCGLQRYVHAYRGTLFAFLSALLSSLTHIILKRCTLFHGSDQALARYAIQFCAVYSYTRCCRRSGTVDAAADATVDQNQRHRSLLIVRGLFGAVGLLAVVGSIKLINPSDTIAILNCKIVLISLAAKLFLDEKFTLVHVLALATTLLGVLLISQPRFLTKLLLTTNSTTPVDSSSLLSVQPQLLGVTLALCAAVSVTVIYTVVKKMCTDHVPVSLIMLYACYFGLPATLAVSVVLRVLVGAKSSPSHEYMSGEYTSELVLQVGLTVVTGVLEVVSQLCTNMALKYEDASKVALVKSSEMIMTNRFQRVFLRLASDVLSTVGAVLIFGSVCAILVHKLFDQRFVRKYGEYLEREKSSGGGRSVGRFEGKTPSQLQKVIFFKF